MNKKIYRIIAILSMCITGVTLSFAQDQEKTTLSDEASGLTITTDGVTTTTDAVSTSEENANNGVAYLCTLNDSQRRIEIDLLNSPEPVPCEVNYYKDTEAPGTKSTLWAANNDAYYCKNQAEAFIEKLQSMSWACASQ